MAEEKGCLKQPQEIIYRNMERSVDIPCIVSNDCLDLEYKWFVFKENNHFELNTEMPNYSLNGASLNIKFLNLSDSGVYYCAVISSHNPATQYIAEGTTVVVKEPFKIKMRHILLWLSCILLAIYSVAIVSLIIVKKRGCHQICRKNTSTETTVTEPVHFHDVLQELYKRRGLKNTQIATTKTLHNQYASAESNSTNDDIYQNV
ncbi:immunoglobulin superfamily member 6 isoform X2 [Boleophthalmus pectinirostris]|nr:immunoglobulin superfamily member 6 isoform X2 [Boleophthalmus pectinirostris]